MPVHPLRLKRPDRCVRCGVVLEAGTGAMWDSETARVWCEECPPVPAVHPLQERWQRLVRYLRVGVEAEGTRPLLELRSPRWAVLPLGEETVFARGARQVPLDPDLDRLAGRLQTGHRLYYGWPAVVVGDCVAPLFAVELGRPTRLGGALPLVGQPALNHALASEAWFDASAVAAVRGLCGNRLPVGDALEMRRLADAVAVLWGLPAAEPGRLLGALPRTAGMHHAAVAVIADGSAVDRALVDELRTLEERTDWSGTSAAWLLGLPLPPDLERPGPPAAPVALSRSQEEAVQSLRTRALSIVLAPPGSGQGRVGLAALANAWLDGDSVLLAAPTDAALDGIVGQARAVHPGMVLRAGGPDVDRVAVAVRDAPPVDDDAARRDLRQAASIRGRAQEGVARQSAVHMELLDALQAEEEAARRAWGGPPLLEPDPAALLRSAERLAQARFLGGLRRRSFLRRSNCVDTARVEDLADWARATLRFRAAALELEEEPAPDDEPWVRAGRTAAAAAVAARLARSLPLLDSRARARPGAALEALRAWACPVSALAGSFPLHAGLFDLAVLSGAAQGSVAALLPLAYRARRLAVVGDPQQGPPGTTLDDIRREELARDCGSELADLEQAGLEHGTGSAFDVCAARSEATLLDEHFRCAPDVARWLDERFYGGALTVLTEVGALRGPHGLFWVDVEGDAEPAPGGSLVNRAEADALVARLGEELSQGASIAVLTPFQAQAALLRSRAQAAFGAGGLARVGFPGGDPVDVVLFSAVLSPGANPRAARWLESQRRLLHGAASRARRALVVFGTPHPTGATLSSLRQAAVGVARSPRPPTEAERRLAEALRGRGLPPALGQVVEGFELGLVLERLEIQVEAPRQIDAQGRRRARALARDRVLQGLGYRVMRVPAWKCLRDPEGVADDVLRELRHEAVHQR